MAEKKNKDIEFEAAMKRIDEISEKLEDSSLTLDESLALYEEGVSLVRVCRKKLEEAEQKISCIYPNEDGEMAEKPFSFEGEQ